MTIADTTSPPKWFRVMYLVPIIINVVLLLLAVFRGIEAEAESAMSLSIYIMASFFMTPVWGVFFVLNVWSVLRYKSHRKIKIVLLPLLLVWIIWGIDNYLHMTFP